MALNHVAAGSGENGRTTNEAGSAQVGGSSVALPLAIEKLRGKENYTTWASAMQTILIREGCWEAVSSAETVKSQALVPEDLKQRALAIICLNLERCNYSLVLEAADARSAWKKLESAFRDNGSGLARKIELLRKFTSIRLVNCQTVEAYVDELMSTGHKLATVGFKVDDSWMAAMLLVGLPEPDYEPMIMGLEASGIVLTADAVKSKILQDAKIEQGPSSCSEEGALYSKQGPRKCKPAHYKILGGQKSKK